MQSRHWAGRQHLRHLLPEVRRIAVQLVSELAGGRQHVERRYACARNWRRDGVGEDVGARALPQALNDVSMSCRVATCARNRQVSDGRGRPSELVKHDSARVLMTTKRCSLPGASSCHQQHAKDRGWDPHMVHASVWWSTETMLDSGAILHRPGGGAAHDIEPLRSIN